MGKIKKIILYLILIIIAIFFAFPFFWMLSTSFKGAEGVFVMPPQWIPKHFTLINFKSVFNRVPICRFLFNSLIITTMGISLNLFLSILAAYPLGRLNFQGKNIILALIIAPLMIPMEGKLVVNYIIIKNLNLLNTYLGVVLPSAVNVIGILLLKGAFEAIPKEIEDAARIDGCGELRIWWQIMLPMVKPSLAALSILSFVLYWNSFLWPLIILKDRELYPLSVGLTTLASAFEYNFRYISAGGVIAIIPIVIFFYYTQRYFVEGFKGAVKG